MARRIHPDHHDHHGPPVHQDGDGERRLRSHIEKVRPGDDPADAIRRLYSYGRHYPRYEPHDGPRERTPHPQYPQPGWDEYRATFRPARNSPVSPAPDEQACQFPTEKIADHVDTSGWVRGMGGEAPHPFFDSGPSGHRRHRR